MAKVKKGMINKEQMFKKIMPTIPTIQDSLDTEDDETSEIEDDEINEKMPYVKPTSINAKKATINIMQNSNLREKDIDLKHKKDKVRTKNAVEDIVEDKLDAVLSRFKCCKCEICRGDIERITLNNLDPEYIKGTDEEIIEQLNIMLKRDNSNVTSAILKACIYVRANPSHK